MLQIVGKTYAVPRELSERVAKAAFSYLRLNDAEIELKFVSKAEILRLNSIYRHKPSVTDVLSFNLDEKPLMGQVFICYTFTSEQAKKLGKTLENEAALLLVHGILHITGYDHENDKDMLEMQRVEGEILNTIGIKR